MAEEHPQLGGVWEKLRRANAHTDYLEKRVGRILEERLYRTITEPHFEEGDEVGYFLIRSVSARPHPVNEIGVIVGDIVHNLRSALDHLVWQLAILNGHDPPPNGTEFPVFWEHDAYHAVKSSGEPRPSSGLFKVRALDATDQTLIESFQPYQMNDSKGHSLWVLHDLANIDKHRVCAVTIAAPQWAFHRDPTFHECEFITDRHQLGPYEDGAEVARYHVRKTGPDPKMNMEIRFSYTTDFAKDGPARGKGLGWALDHMRRAVVHVVRSFEPRFGL